MVAKVTQQLIHAYLDELLSMSVLNVPRARLMAQQIFGCMPNPVGVGHNRKVAGADTWRPVKGEHSTCPECPWQTKCYATESLAASVEKRATDNTAASIAAACIMAVEALRKDQVGRLHVSGDFGKRDYAFGDVGIDWPYINGLVHISTHPKFSDKNPWAYTYTSFKPDDFAFAHVLLQASGVEVIWSNQPIPGGAVVWRHARVTQLQAFFPHVHFVPCVYQTHGTSCMDCGLCWKPQLGNCIVFEPHGRLRTLTDRQLGWAIGIDINKKPAVGDQVLLW